MKRYLYMVCETDGAQLPIAVADSPKELGAMIGCTKGSVYSYFSRAQRNKGITAGREWVKVEVLNNDIPKF